MTREERHAQLRKRLKMAVDILEGSVKKLDTFMEQRRCPECKQIHRTKADREWNHEILGVGQ